MGQYLSLLKYNIVYMLIALMCCFIYFVFDKKSNKIKPIDWLAATFMVCVTGWRINVGSDFYSYYLRFNYYADMTFDYLRYVIKERLFAVLCIVAGQLSDNPYFGFWVVAIILYVPLVVLARKKTMYPSICVASYIFLGFFGMSHNILRQMIAMTILMYFFYAIKEKKYILSIVLGILAVGFHSSSLIAIALIVLSFFVKATRRKLLVAIIIANIIRLLIIPTFTFAQTVIPYLSRYSGYIEQIQKLGSTRIYIGILGYVVFFIAVEMYLLSCDEKDFDISLGYSQITTMVMFGIFLSIIATKLWVINRVSVYFYQFVIFLAPTIFNRKGKNNSLTITRIALSVVVLFWFGFINLYGCENLYNEYHFQWENISPRYY